MSSRWSKVALAAVVATFATVAIVHAQSGGSVVHSCVNADGSLKVLSDPTGFKSPDQTCSTGQGQHVLDWNQQGPTGSTGSTGPQGPAGASGGAQRNFVVVSETTRTASNHSEEFLVHADCPDGHFVTGGGYGISGTATLIDQDYLIYNGPDYRGSVDSSVGTASSWVVHTVQSVKGPGKTSIRVFAVCTGDPPPGFGKTPKVSGGLTKLKRDLALNPKLKSRRITRFP